MANILFFNPNRMMGMMTSSMRKDEDSLPITLNITISAGLNKFRNSRINAVAKALGISTKDVKKDKIEQIISKLTTELNEVTEKLPPKSTVGILRLHALLFVGKAGIDGRNYEVAVVPKDIRKQLAELL